MEKIRIFVCSNFAKDIINNKNESTILEKAGGPAFWITSYFKKNNIKYFIPKENKKDIVLIKINKYNQEYGSIKKLNRICIEKKISSKTSATIVSTLGNQISQKYFNTMPNIFLDVQGFVRSGNNMKLNKYNSKFIAIKTTNKELLKLDKKFVNYYKINGILIITKGKDRIVAWDHGEKILIPVRPIYNLHDTIGAGDTFLAAFVVKYIIDNNCKNALIFARNETRKFLAIKNKS